MATTTDATFGVFTPGVLEVLSIGRGDLTLHVGTNDDDRDRAREVITEMLRKGYAIFVETDHGPERVTAFNPQRMTYTIADGPDEALAAGSPPEEPAEVHEAAYTEAVTEWEYLESHGFTRHPGPKTSAERECLARPDAPQPATRQRGVRKPTRQVPVAGSRATAVGRTAGG